MYGFIEARNNYPDLSRCKNALSQCLTMELYESLFAQCSNTGFSLDKAIQVGLDSNDEDSVGFFIGDEDSLQVFEPLLSQLLIKCQPFFNYKDLKTSHKHDLSPAKFEYGVFTVTNSVSNFSFTIRRNLKGYNLTPHCTRAERREVNLRLCDVLSSLSLDTIDAEIKENVRLAATPDAAPSTTATAAAAPASPITVTAPATSSPSKASQNSSKKSKDGGSATSKKKSAAAAASSTTTPPKKGTSKRLSHDVASSTKKSGKGSSRTRKSADVSANVKLDKKGSDSKKKRTDSNGSGKGSKGKRSSSKPSLKDSTNVSNKSSTKDSSASRRDSGSADTESKAESPTPSNFVIDPKNNGVGAGVGGDDRKESDNANVAKDGEVIGLVDIDEGTLCELEDLALAPARELSVSDVYLVGGLARDFPDARSLYFHRSASIGGWTNHENHLEIVIHCLDYDLPTAFHKFIIVHEKLRRAMKSREMQFLRHRRLGWITTSPAHFGSGLTIAFDIVLPQLQKHSKFKRILSKKSLRLKNAYDDGIMVRLETIHTLGRTETEIVQQLDNDLVALIRMEKLAAKNKPIDNLI